MTLWQAVIITRPGQEYPSTKVFKDRAKAIAHAERLRMQAERGTDQDARIRIDMLLFDNEELVS